MTTPVERRADEIRREMEKHPDKKDILLQKLIDELTEKFKRELAIKIVKGLGFELLDDRPGGPLPSNYLLDDSAVLVGSGEAEARVLTLPRSVKNILIDEVVYEADQRIIDSHPSVVKLILGLRIYSPKALLNTYGGSGINAWSLYRVQKILLKYGYLEQEIWNGKAKKTWAITLYKTFDCTDEDRAYYLEPYKVLDQKRIQDEIKSILPDSEVIAAIEEAEYQRKLAQKRGIQRANAELTSVKYEDPTKSELKQKVAELETETIVEDIKREMKHTCSKSCHRNLEGECIIVIGKKRKIRDQQIKLGKTLLKYDSEQVQHLKDHMQLQPTKPQKQLLKPKKTSNDTRRKELIRIIQEKNFVLNESTIDEVLRISHLRGRSLFAEYARRMTP